MEYPPTEWPCFASEDFEVAVPRDPGLLGLEVMAMARVTGRIVDHFRVAVGGTAILKARFTTRDLFLSESLPQTALIMETWPRDVVLRRNMTTSEWMDVSVLLASNDIEVDGEGARGSESPDTNEELLGILRGGKERPSYAASVRWAVTVGSDGLMELNLQGFPAASTTLTGKPALRG